MSLELMRQISVTVMWLRWLAGLSALACCTLQAAWAGEVSLTGGRSAVFRSAHGSRPDLVRVLFKRDPALASLPDPRCPATSSLRFNSLEQDTGGIPLPCENWTRQGDGYRYRAASDAPRSRMSILLREGVLKIRVLGITNGAITGPVPFVESRLTIGSTSFCGSFKEFRRNGERIKATRGTEACWLRRPNFIVINLDDVRSDGLDQMPVVESRLQRYGVRFENAFTPAAVCSPSRASILTGLYAVHHGTRHVYGAIGGAHTFRKSGADQQTIAVWLQRAGYRTGLFGKYLNTYSDFTEGSAGPGGSFYIPPGWDRWWAFVSSEHYGGVHGETYEIIEEGGLRTTYSNHDTDAEYSTDVSAEILRAFIANSVGAESPFFAYWAPYAAHVETPSFLPAPAARHFGAFEGLPLWRPPNWGEADVSDKPRWVQVLSTRAAGPGFTDLVRELAYESLLSVDEQIDALLDHLAVLGVEEDTVIFFTSDNGTTWGEHRWWGQKKLCPYEECQRVPMLVRYPRRIIESPTTRSPVALNIDVAPTIAWLAGVAISTEIDGESFHEQLFSDPPQSGRSDYLLEGWRVDRSAQLYYSGQVLDGDRFRLYYGDPVAKPRASVVFEFDAGDGISGNAVPVAIGVDAHESISNLRMDVEANVPGVNAIHSVDDSVLLILNFFGNHTGIYWWEELDQGNVIEPDTPMPDYFGVRDVENGLTWVEYETGERELYDLNIDPYQLDNKADDPMYALTRDSLEQRLDELLSR